MKSIRSLTTAAAALSVALTMAAPGAAWAQTAQSGSPPSKAQMQEELDREKVTLKDEAQSQIDAATANIDALRRMDNSNSGAGKKRHDDMKKQLSDSRSRLKDDLTKIDQADLSDWVTVRPVIQQDLTALNAQLQQASPITNVPVPQWGTTNRQP
jgi:hypothetical protein